MLIGVALLWFQLAPPITPPSQPVVENRIVNEVHVIPQPLDPEAVAEATVQSNRATMGMVIAPPPIDWANQLLNLPDIWRRTPPELTYNNPAVREMNDRMRQAATVLAVLAAAGWLVGHMTGHAPSPGRFLFAIVMMTFSLLWCQWAIDGNNAICAFIGAPDLAGMIRPHLALPADPVEQTTATVLVVVYAIVAILLLLTLIFRLALIIILIAIAPLAMLCYAIPQTEAMASLWTRTFTGQVFSQVLIVLGIALAQVLNSMGTGIVGSFLSLIMILSVRRLPGLLASGQERGGRSMLGTVTGLIGLRRLAFR